MRKTSERHGVGIGVYVFLCFFSRGFGFDLVSVSRLFEGGASGSSYAS
jgi:hypothetical protein